MVNFLSETVLIGFKAGVALHLGRALVYQGLHHRRVVSKTDGRAVNTWMRGLLDDLDATPQVLGTAGPIDPELSDRPGAAGPRVGDEGRRLDRRAEVRLVNG